MRLPQPLVEAVFRSRLDRFSVAVAVEGKGAVAHLPNSGRLEELLAPFIPLVVTPTPRAPRTSHRVVLARPGPWVAVDASNAPRLVEEAFRTGLLPLQGYRLEKREPAVGSGRLDLLYTSRGCRLYVEAKCVTLVEDGTGLFPDAATARGARHIQELEGLVDQGHRAMVVFVIQRPGASRFRANARRDPAFAEALSRAAGAGVEVYAIGCEVGPRECLPVSRVTWDG